MEFEEVVRRRRMIRNYSSEALPVGVIDRIVEHATRAPSAGFSQGWAFLVLSELADRQQFWRHVDLEREQDSSLATAPLLIVALANKQPYLENYADGGPDGVPLTEDQWPVPYWFVDTGMAALMMLLTAVDAGLGACFFGITRDHIDEFRLDFGVPPEYVPTGVVSVGYRHPDVEAQAARLTERRRSDVQVIHHGKWHAATAS